ncbi:MAG: pseudouridine synthase [Desulfatitalea sp. BRH_c12]|nr:MAG: pseudouridine synthase [Desulfatitalea sp. BRH_c12]
MHFDSGPSIHTVSLAQAGSRLDAFVSAHWPQQGSRSQAGIWIRAGHVRVDGRPCKPGYKVKAGEVVSVQVPEPVASDLLAEKIPLDIVFEDSAVIVINKPAGLVVHPAAGHPSGTLVNALLHHCPDLEGIGGERRPGIVHRLDKDTSGLLIVAKNDRAHHCLSLQFKERTISKNYLALVTGSVAQDSGCIDRPIGRHSVERKRMAVVAYGGRQAVTLWQVRERFGCATLLGLELKTGRTHQIRVHCQSMGHPIVGDPVYCRRRALPRLGVEKSALDILRNVQRQMLHAARLRFVHPVSEQIMTFEAPLPDDMISVLQALRDLH